MSESLNEAVALDLPFKGERDYLHATDLFDALLGLTGAREGLSLRIQSMMRTGVAAIPLDQLSHRRDAKAFFQWSDGADRRTLALCEDGRSVDRRVPYNEDEITASSKLEGSTVHLQPNPRYSFIERVVAHQKLLLNRTVAEIPWLFARIEVDMVPSAQGELSITLADRMGTRLVRSEINDAGGRIGSICFGAHP